MLEFSLDDGNPVRINVALIEYIQPADEGTLIAFVSGNFVTLREPYDVVVASIQSGSRASLEGSASSSV